MNKLKNPNIVLALIFSLLSAIISFFSLMTILDKYPVSFLGIYLFSLNFLIFIAAILLFIGVLLTKKNLLIIGSGVLIIESIVYAVLYAINSARFYSSFEVAFNFLFLLIPTASFFLLVLYIGDIIKNKKLILISLTLSFVILFISTFFIGGLSSVFLVSSYILLLFYVNIADVEQKVKMGEVFYLSVITFGIFYLLWTLSVIKKANKIKGETPSLISECLFFIIFPPYTAYWFYTRYEDINKASPIIENRGVLCMVLSLFLLSPLSLCIMQRDLNDISTDFIRENQSEEITLEDTEF